MKLVIFTLGLVFLTVGQANPVDKKLIHVINAVEAEAKSILVEVATVIHKGLPITREQVLELVLRNGWVIQAEKELKHNYGRKECQALLKENTYIVVDQVTVIAKETLISDLIQIEKELKSVIIKLENLKEKLDYHHSVHKVKKEVNQLAQTVSNLKVTVSGVLSLGKIESNVIPDLARVKILEPVTQCLKHHSHHPHY